MYTYLCLRPLYPGGPVKKSFGRNVTSVVVVVVQMRGALEYCKVRVLHLPLVRRVSVCFFLNQKDDDGCRLARSLPVSLPSAPHGVDAVYFWETDASH